MFGHARPQTHFPPDCNPERLFGLKRGSPGPLQFIGAVEIVDTDLRQVQEALGLLRLPRRNASSRTWSRSITGGTMLIARSDLLRAGAWRQALRHVDRALVDDVLSAGGTVYRTHDEGYVLVRHGEEHIWVADDGYFLDQADEVRLGWQPALAGIPEDIVADPLRHHRPHHRRGRRAVRGASVAALRNNHVCHTTSRGEAWHARAAPDRLAHDPSDALSQRP